MKMTLSPVMSVVKAKEFDTWDGPGLKIYSNDLDTLKKIWISLSIDDAEYEKLMKNGDLE